MRSQQCLCKLLWKPYLWTSNMIEMHFFFYFKYLDKIEFEKDDLLIHQESNLPIVIKLQHEALIGLHYQLVIELQYSPKPLDKLTYHIGLLNSISFSSTNWIYLNFYRPTWYMFRFQYLHCIFSSLFECLWPRTHVYPLKWMTIQE